MRFKYKTVKMRIAHCPKCEQPISGNGSGILPYFCNCGEYEFNQETGEYDLLPPEGFTPKLNP